MNAIVMYFAVTRSRGYRWGTNRCRGMIVAAISRRNVKSSRDNDGISYRHHKNHQVECDSNTADLFTKQASSNSDESALHGGRMASPVLKRSYLILF